MRKVKRPPPGLPPQRGGGSSSSKRAATGGCPYESRGNARGVSLLVVIFVVVVFSLLGVTLMLSVTAGWDEARSMWQGAQAEALAHSAVELALLEVGEKTRLAAAVLPAATRLMVLDADELPGSGQVLVAGGRLFGASWEWVEYRRGTDGLEPLGAGFEYAHPLGARVYLGQDLDGNGALASLAPRTVAEGRLWATVTTAGGAAVGDAMRPPARILVTGWGQVGDVVRRVSVSAIMR